MDNGLILLNEGGYMNYLYNGVGPLPDIYTVYTPELQEEFPFAVMKAFGDDFLLYLCKIRPHAYFKDDGVTVRIRAIGEDGDVTNCVYYSSGQWAGEWILSTATSSYMFFDLSEFIWTSHAIYYEDGVTLFLEKSPAPVPVPQLNPAALMQGYMVGQAIRRMRGLKKPVAYLYNGVRLPALPETTYPYVVIRSVGGVYYLYFSKTMPYHSIRTNGNEYIMVGSGAEEDLLQYYYDGGELYTEWDFISKDNGVYFSPDALVWTNTDINKEDGTLYLAASEPIPVYE